MKVAPEVLGTCTLVPVAGAVAGMSVNTTPLAAETVSTIPKGSTITVADGAPLIGERLPLAQEISPVTYNTESHGVLRHYGLARLNRRDREGDPR